jgi:hypothetical protein
LLIFKLLLLQDFSVFTLLHFIALQKHYSNLEALALDKDAPENINDLTGTTHGEFSFKNV